MMSPELRRRSLIAFFLGSEAANRSKNDPELVPIVSRRAYRDFSRTLHGIRTHPHATTLRGTTSDSLKAFVARLENIETADAFDQAHDEWCLTTKDAFNQHAQGAPSNFRLHYGQAQKWLNMTLKYLAVLEHEPVSHVYRFMHVPVDKVIFTEARKRLGVRPPGGTAWSRLNGEQYRDYQSRLKHEIRSQGEVDCIPMEWEAHVWIQRGNKFDN